MWKTGKDDDDDDDDKKKKKKKRKRTCHLVVFAFPDWDQIENKRKRKNK